MSVPANIRAIRKRRGMTQDDLASAMGVEQTTIARWELGTRPLNTNRLTRLAEVLGVEMAELMETSASAAPAAPPTGFAAPASTFIQPPMIADLPRDLPVMGTALGADLDVSATDSGVANAERLELSLVDVIEYVKRPQGLRGNAASYALYVQGYSMSPRLEQGDLIYVDTRRPPSMGDDVVVQLCAEEGDDQAVITAMVKRLVRRTSQYVELEQFNPALRFTIPVNKVHAVHRVVRLAELLGI
ncbi:LexA family transcriptional regulator [Sandarakinorhabdus sp.]|uniref:LexA family transcriptional regulator n=1 Tax=Sandarakinorhabdus sp. TaxID=1916663 RepID=UPI00286D8E5A|nr:LexA family transcriptional regulator [Sandarakinorhabdus sp.]